MSVTAETHAEILDAADSAGIQVTFVARGRVQLLAPVIVMFEGVRIVVPMGFTSDGASIPPIAWPLVGHPLSGSSLRAALVHDWLTFTRTTTSAFCVRAFAAVLRADGVAPFRAWCLVHAVQWFGPHWKTPRVAA